MGLTIWSYFLQGQDVNFSLNAYHNTILLKKRSSILLTSFNLLLNNWAEQFSIILFTKKQSRKIEEFFLSFDFNYIRQRVIQLLDPRMIDSKWSINNGFRFSIFDNCYFWVEIYILTLFLLHFKIKLKSFNTQFL